MALHNEASTTRAAILDDIPHRLGNADGAGDVPADAAEAGCISHQLGELTADKPEEEARAEVREEVREEAREEVRVEMRR